MANAGLRGKMDDVGKAVLAEQCGHSVAVGEVKPDETHASGLLELAAAGVLQRGVVICVHIVEADHVAAVFQQTPGDMKADKPGCSGDQDGSVSHRPSSARS